MTITSNAMEEAILRFNETVKRLHEILGEYGEITRAKNIPDALANDVRRVKIQRGDGYVDAGDGAVLAVRAAVAEAVNAERRRGEAMRDEKLAALSAEIGALRAVLPHQAARAAIALGEIERKIKGNRNDD